MRLGDSDEILVLREEGGFRELLYLFVEAVDVVSEEGGDWAFALGDGRAQSEDVREGVGDVLKKLVRVGHGGVLVLKGQHECPYELTA